MRNTWNRSRWLVALLGALALVTTACGNDDGPASGGGGGGGGAMSEQAFCDSLAEAEAADLDDDEALAAFALLANRAPNPELRSAMNSIAEVVELLEDLDEDDPESVSQAFSVMFDPEFMEAAETIEQFMVETCGMDTGSDWDDDMWDDDDWDDDQE